MCEACGQLVLTLLLLVGYRTIDSRILVSMVKYTIKKIFYDFDFSPAVLAVNRAARDAMVTGMMMQCKKG